MATAAGAPPLVLSDATDAPGDHARAATLFAGLSFFLVQRLPARSQLTRDIERNGGRVVKLERQADYVIADHARSDAPVGSYSWKLITAAIDSGAMPADPSEFPAGPRPGTVRDVGSGMPAKATRTPFTREDDRELWQWVEQEKARGSLVKGNELYKRLEQVNPRHTFQAWRDRYIKKLMSNPPAGLELQTTADPPRTRPVADDDPDTSKDFPTPPAKRRKVETARDVQDHAEAASGEGPARTHNGTEEGSHEMVEVEQDREQEDNRGSGEADDRDPDDVDIGNLLSQASEIENIAPNRRKEAWEAWSHAFPHRDSIQWQLFYLQVVQPIYRAQCEAEQPHEQLDEEAPVDAHATRKRKRDLDTESIGEGRDQSPEPAASPSPAVDGSGHNQTAVAVANGHQPASESSAAGRGNEGELQGGVAMADLPTSDATQAADKQIMSEVPGASEAAIDTKPTDRGPSEGPHSQQGDETGPVSHRSVHIDTTGEITHVRSRNSPTSGNNGQHQAPSIRSTSSRHSSIQAEPTVCGGTALTEANLAQQEAQSKAPLVRGADLPEDEPARDQSDFVRFLQDTMANGNDAQDSAATKPSSLPDANESMPAGYCSPNEIDEVLRANAEWPSSPQQPRCAVPSGSFVAGRSAKSQQDTPPGADHGSNEPHAEDTRGPPADLHDERHHGAESEHDIDLSGAFSAVGGGFDQSSDHVPSQIISNGSSEPADYTATTYQPQSRVHEAISTAKDLISISSASSSSFASTTGSEDHEQEQTGSTRARTLLETQDIFSAATQGPDLTMPLPPDSDDLAEEEADETLYELDQPGRITGAPTLEGTEATPKSAGPEEEAIILDSWISTMEVRGYEEQYIIQALKCTSMRLDLAELVLVHIKSGKGVPGDVPGVWSDEEDEELESGHAACIRRLEAKHGWDACKARLAYLEEYRDSE